MKFYQWQDEQGILTLQIPESFIQTTNDHGIQDSQAILKYVPQDITEDDLRRVAQNYQVEDAAGMSFDQLVEYVYWNAAREITLD